MVCQKCKRPVVNKMALCRDCRKIRCKACNIEFSPYNSTTIYCFKCKGPKMPKIYDVAGRACSEL